MNMEINGVTLQVDFLDADFMEKFEPALYELQDEINKSKTMKGPVAAGYQALNECVENFFNAVFDTGTSDLIFKGSRNVMVHLGAVAQISEAYKAARKQFNDFSNKYTQRQNGFQSMQGHRQKQQKQNNNRQ